MTFSQPINLDRWIETAVNNIIDDMQPLYEAFYADEDARTCGNCVALHPGKPPGPRG